MQIDRKIAHAPRSRALASDMATMPSACVGCDGCQGICQSLIDAMLLPDLLLRERAA